MPGDAGNLQCVYIHRNLECGVNLLVSGYLFLAAIDVFFYIPALPHFENMRMVHIPEIKKLWG